MGSARHLGEESLGTWTLHIKDGRRQNTGTLESWSLTFYGQGEAPEKPTNPYSAETGDTSLDVSWNRPHRHRGLPRDRATICATSRATQRTSQIPTGLSTPGSGRLAS